MSSEGSELELTVKYTVPPARLIGVLPSDSRNVRLTVRVSPLITLLIVLPSLAIVYSYSKSIEGEADELGDTELDGLLEPLGDTDALALELGETELEGETELDGLIDVLAEGDSELEGDGDALGDSDGDALLPTAADSKNPSLLIGFQIILNRIVPLVTADVPIVKMMSSVTIFSGATVDNSIPASGVASCQISTLSKSVPVDWAISPAVVLAVPNSSVAEAPAISASNTAITLTATVPVTLNRVLAPTEPVVLPAPNFTRL